MKTQSILLREKGNSLYSSTNQEGLGSSMKTSRLKDAINYYQQAKNSSSNLDEQASAAKNIGMASKKLVGLMVERKDVSDCKYYFNEAVRNFDVAYRFSSCKSNEWVDDLLLKFHEIIQGIITYYTTPDAFEFNEMTIALENYAHSVEYARDLRCDLSIEIAQLRFRKGITQLTEKDYKKCLYQMKECYRPIEEARKNGEDLGHIMDEVRILEADVFMHECICRSHQARIQGDKMLEKYLKGEEMLNMEMVWTVVDLYKEAILLTREKDAEGEAIALSRLGSIFDKVLKQKNRAKPYMMQSIQLAMSLHPKTFNSEEWFKDARATLDRYQQEFVRQEDQVWNEQRMVYLKEIEEDMKIVKHEEGKGKVDFLRYIYKTYPPRWREDCTLPDTLPEESASYEEWKPIFRNAMIHYHPDKANVESDGKKWKVLCEEISKDLSTIYENMKRRKI